jgi:Acetyltransferase (GNAT) family
MSDKFGGPLQARRGELLDVLALPGFIAERDDRTIGLATYRLEHDECELAFIATHERHAGVGTALLNALTSRGFAVRSDLARHDQRQPRSAPLLSAARLRPISASSRSSRSGAQTAQTSDLDGRRVRNPAARRNRTRAAAGTRIDRDMASRTPGPRREMGGNLGSNQPGGLRSARPGVHCCDRLGSSTRRRSVPERVDDAEELREVRRLDNVSRARAGTSCASKVSAARGSRRASIGGSFEPPTRG